MQGSMEMMGKRDRNKGMTRKIIHRAVVSSHAGAFGEPRIAPAGLARAFCRAVFPPPWTIEERNVACFIVKDRSGQARGGAGRRAAANLLTRDEARRIAANIAKPPALLRKP
jgi:hypothetical protein